MTSEHDPHECDTEPISPAHRPLIPASPEWYESHNELIGLALWLESKTKAFTDVLDVLQFFHKPWKWQREYDLWQWWTEEDSEEICEQIVTAVIEGKTVPQLVNEIARGE